MRFFLFLFLLLIHLYGDFSKKNIIRIEKNSDIFDLIELNSTSSSLDSQKALFDSSTLKEKAKITKDEKLDFAIVFSFRENFGYADEKIKEEAKIFSQIFAQNTLKSLKLNFINATANGIYQSQKTLQNFSPKDAQLVNIASFLKKEKDKNKIYADFVDYLIVINLNDFYIQNTQFFFTQSTNAKAQINFKLISSTKGLIKAKNIALRFALAKDKSAEQNYQKVLDEMPQMLTKVIAKESRSLKP